jgi:outer membrane protein OmpA-like peptidoglycan-associated protein
MPDRARAQPMPPAAPEAPTAGAAASTGDVPISPPATMVPPPVTAPVAAPVTAPALPELPARSPAPPAPLITSARSEIHAHVPRVEDQVDRAVGDQGGPGDGDGTGLGATLLGPIGLLRTGAAFVGRPGSWRLGLRGEYSSANSFIVKGDRNRRLAGDLAFSLTPLRHWELFLALLATTNHNERCTTGLECPAEPVRLDPPFIRSSGDVVLGTKIAGPVSKRVSLGLQAGARLYTSESSLGFDTGATSPFVDGLGTLDLRGSAALPVVLHANLGYVADRSRNLGGLEQVPPAMVNSRAVASFAYGIALPRVRTAVGLSAPVPTRGGPTFAPFVEYQLERITGDHDAAFSDYTAPRCGTAGAPACSDQKVQQRIGFGLRVATSSGLGFDFGVEIGAASVGVAYGPPLAPWNLIFGLGYAFDAGSRERAVVRTVIVERVVERPATATLGFVGGRVLDARDGMPIGGAIIDVVGATRARVATDSDGAFISKGLRAGPVDLEIGAPGFGSQAARAIVTPGTTAPLEVTLLPLPPQPVWPAQPDLATPPPPVQPAPPAAASNAGVVLQAGRLVWRRPLRFEGAPGNPTAALTTASQQLLDELAALLAQHPEIERVRIEAHVDNSLGQKAALALTQSQAEAIAQHLVSRGVPAGRLEAIGVGASRPRVPNLGPQSRARNQRVEITLPGSGSGATSPAVTPATPAALP